MKVVDLGEVVLKNDAVMTPFMCENEDEFFKSLFIISNAIPAMVQSGKAGMIDASEMYVDMFKMMAHDYLALVLSGEIKPYEFTKTDSGKEEYAEMRKIFENALQNLNVTLAMSGVPVKEEDNGKIKVDYEELRRQHEAKAAKEDENE